ncbi:hypothetical protein OC683_00460 ['Crotalaria aegyptiaca' phytoplasma]|uniref:Uncharacterized protein n=1 Tax=Candidatus Phytoplasma crotalariae TaxID=2982627 RepID=A0ABT9D241_9MOLU|nr:hypothetical protein ['Crotalaria aegyptiaca' phytoplasma]MDO8059092.1 hypothetical protein ['Crotalaria aegyptiaca' phytoplasma]
MRESSRNGAWNLEPKKSGHDAIKRVKQRFKGMDYLVQIDLKGYFETIDLSSSERIKPSQLENVYLHYIDLYRHKNGFKDNFKSVSEIRN